MSPRAYNGKVGLAIVCPITDRNKGYPFEVTIPKGLDVKGAVLSDQVKSLDWRARNAEFLCRLPEGTTAEVLQKVGTLISLSVA